MRSDETRAVEPVHRALLAIGPGEPETSIIDLVLLACELSEDEGEIADVVDGAIRSGAVRILPSHRDPMLGRLDAAA